MEQDGFVAHLYAGRDEGCTLSRAFQEVGGDKRRLVEVDVERQGDGDRSHDMLVEEGPYASLFRAALDGHLKGVVMGPNCKTRSVLRHYPLNVPGGGPRPVRSWDEPWGMSRNTAEEQKKVTEDDVLMWRGWMIYIRADEVRRALGDPRSEKVWVGLEKPADPNTLHAGGGHVLEDAGVETAEAEVWIGGADVLSVEMGRTCGQAYHLCWQPEA